MAEVGTGLFLGNTPITTIQDNRFVSANPFDEVVGPSYQFRTDIYSASVVFATPGYLFSDLSMTYDWSDVHADLAGTGTNKTVLTTNVSATTGSNFTSDGYVGSSIAAANYPIYQTDDTDFEYGTGNFTMELWFNSDDSSPTIMFFWKYQAGSAPNSEWFMDIYADTMRIAVSYNGNNEAYLQSSALSWTGGQWYHIAYVRNGTSVRMYRDGVDVGGVTLPSGANINATSNPASIFARPGNTDYESPAKFQDLRVYKGIAKYTSSFTPPESMVYLPDPDAAAFINAAGITDTTQQSAINTLVLDLKANSIWNECDAIYPFVGGNATAHSYNLKDTSTYTITFGGTWTHNSNGITGNGTNTYANTGWNPTTVSRNTDGHMAVYSRTNLNAGVLMSDMGAGSNPTESLMALANSGTTYWIWSGAVRSAAYGNSQGYYVTTRDASNTIGYKNGSSISSGGNTNNHPNVNMYIGAQNTTAAGTRWTSRNYAFASLGTDITDNSTYYTIVQNFQTALSRQV